MRFEYRGELYALDFARTKRRVPQIDYKSGETVTAESMHPFTKVMVLKSKPDIPWKYWEVVYQAEVGCFTHDFFSNDNGRLWALKKLTGKLPNKEFKSLVWNAYMNRKPKMDRASKCPTCGKRGYHKPEVDEKEA